MNISDEKLYELCKMYGTRAKVWRQKFIGLLPEVYRRKLFEKKKFGSIFEFSAKLCGLSADQVRLALNLEKRLEDKPSLKTMFVNGEVSMNKLARVVSIATPENADHLTHMLKILPQKALETLVRDEKMASAYDDEQGYRKESGLHEVRHGSHKQKDLHNEQESEMQKGIPEPLFEDKSLRAQTLNFELSEDVIEELNRLHAQGHDVNGLLRQSLAQRREQIEQEKNEISENIGVAASRYIPVKIRKILQREYGEKCSIKTCGRPAVDIHHSQRFGLSQNHDPKYLAQLCKEHHVIAHSIDRKYLEKRAATCILPCSAM